MPWDQLKQLEHIGFVGGLIFLGWLFFTHKIRLGSDYDEVKGERDRLWRDSYKRQEISRRAVRLADKAGDKKAGAANHGADENPDDR